MKRKLLIVLLIVIAGIIFIPTFFVHTYTSSPGFFTEEGFREFEQNKLKCIGWSTLLNEEETWTDSPGVSRCIGLLTR